MVDEVYKVKDGMTPDTTIGEICTFALEAMVAHGMDSFDFDIHGRGPDGGRVVIHFEATLQKVGTS